MITCVSFFVCLLCMALVNAKSNRIIGGDRATPGQFKYQVSVQIKNNNFCGGAIIADQYILTAAHCVAEYVNEHFQFISMKYQIVAGSTDLLSNEGVRIDVEKIYVPTQFFSGDLRYDIAVLKLHRGLGLGSNPNIQKINLPSIREPTYVRHTAVIAGYGFTYVEDRTDPITGVREEVNGYSDGKLKYAYVKIISNQECDRKNYWHTKTGSKQFCGQVLQRGEQPEGICTGDSGGPLVIGNVIIGVSSQSPRGCSEQQYAAVYIRVSACIGFIEKAMKDAKSSVIVVREIHSDEITSKHEIAESSSRHCN